MRQLITVPVLVSMLALAGAPIPAGAQAGAPSTADSRTIDDIRAKLLRLPYYGVFDFLTFSYEKGTVTLGGYANHGTLKSDAERAVKMVARVDQVVNKIEDLPVSSNDDDLRWKTYYAIYTDPFLARYAPGGGLLWGHRHRVGSSIFGSASRFPGEQPIGIYPIAIIVKSGRITLMGVVDNEGDKNMAGIKANGVTGAFGVENELTVEKQK
jgi:hyperosmotically inducible protein